MGFCFDLADRTPGDAVRRIASELLGDAIALARVAPNPEQLHAIRKNLKMTRGLLRLVAPEFAAFRQENAALRNAARLIAAHRDAEVMAEIVARLASEGAANAALGGAGPDPHSLRTDLDSLAEALAAIAARVPAWQIDKRDFGAFDAGLRKTFCACRSDLKRLRKTRDDAALHGWRGKIKAHWYHARLLQPIWPEMMASHIAVADMLGEMLGEHHDLAVLQAQLKRSDLSAKAARALHKRCAKRKDVAERKAFALAEMLLAEPAKPLARRWRHWWRLWQQGEV